jgi:hypothetical protein
MRPRFPEHLSKEQNYDNSVVPGNSPLEVPRGVADLFHSHGLREIARLVHIRAHEDRRMIGDELHRNGV